MSDRSPTPEAITPAPESSAAAAGAADRIRAAPATRSPTTPRFYVCVGILVAAAISMQGIARALGTYFQKQAVPLKRPLSALDRNKLRPYEPHRHQPPPLSDETVENLGTKEYLAWNLRDRTREADAPDAVVRLFVTYYTGKRDPVPHVPEECWAAGGWEQLAGSEARVTVTAADGRPVTIPVTLLEFAPPGRRGTRGAAAGEGAPRLVVAYFFYANGQYVNSRLGVRRAVANLRDRYAYYSKIELSFHDDGAGRLADREQTLAATSRFLNVLMPVLWQDHYQDWEALRRGAAPVVLDR